MSVRDRTEGFLNASCQEFSMSLLPLYSGPYVGIRIGSGNHEYKLSKALLCKQSPYFAATFEGRFQEGKEQSTTLEEIDGVVSENSLRMLLQWLYLGRIIFGELSPKEAITATIEFVRFADMCGVTGMESVMAKHIGAIIVANPAPQNQQFQQRRDPDTNTYCLTSQNIESAALLPQGHAVRSILATAAVEGYFRDDNFKFLREAQELPSFSVDLLNAVKATLKTLTYDNHRVNFTDPITGMKLEVNTLLSLPTLYISNNT